MGWFLVVLSGNEWFWWLWGSCRWLRQVMGWLRMVRVGYEWFGVDPLIFGLSAGSLLWSLL